MMDSIYQIPLITLFTDVPVQILDGRPDDTRITGIAIDSRRVLPGYLFVALKGSSVDGHNFIQEAIKRGASAVVGEKQIKGLPVQYVQVDDSRQALTWLAAAFYGNPGRKLTVIGVTGTDGKTTTCNLLYQIFVAAGIKAGLISTVNAIIGDDTLDTGLHVTTPDAQDVQRYLARMVEVGLTHVILETTSHGWAQHRVDACEFDIGVVTNITHEHLDEHGTFEKYRSAKARLFQFLEKTSLKPQGNVRLSVLNRDDSSYEYLSHLSTQPKVSYGLDPDADVRAININFQEGTRFEATGTGFRVPVFSPLPGEYNVSNCLAAMTAAIHGLGIDPEVAAKGIASLNLVPGRWEEIKMGQPFSAVVDFAHTPNALRVAISSASKLVKNRVIVIFGSAGLRDPEKRRMMAEIAAQLADISIFTAEDPRTESLEAILLEMAAGALSKGGEEGKTFFRVPNRADAIRLGVHLAQPGDIVLSCGKGHELSMCIGTQEYPWDDRLAMRAALSELMDIDGPKMPYLPI
jgi:UDP-N-acetylmuramoyl-L-alanyl-D-glutamate--2,6-diaminopimelate ligase